MKRIYKYPIPLGVGETGEFKLELPLRHKILSVGPDPQGVGCIWVEVGE